MDKVFIVMVSLLTTSSVLANLSGMLTKVTFAPGMIYQSRLFGRMLFTTSKKGTINYVLNETMIGESKGELVKEFAVALSQRDNGDYDIKPLRDQETLLEGSFVRNADHTAVLEYKNEDDSWVKMVFSNTRTSPPKTDEDKEKWRLGVIIVVTDGLPGRGKQLLKIEDELQWVDLTGPVVVGLNRQE